MNDLLEKAKIDYPSRGALVSVTVEVTSCEV